MANAQYRGPDSKRPSLVVTRAASAKAPPIATPAIRSERSAKVRMHPYKRLASRQRRGSLSEGELSVSEAEVEGGEDVDMDGDVDSINEDGDTVRVKVCT